MKRFNKASPAFNGGHANTTADHGNDVVSRSPDGKCGFNLMKLMGLFLVSVMGFSVLFSLSVVLRDPPSDSLWTVSETNNLDHKVHRAILQQKDDHSQLNQSPNGNLLPSGFDKESCLSRFESLLYRKGTQREPSPYLVSKLRSYEALHKKCGPHSESYNKTVQHLKSGRNSTSSDCKYIVWISFSGLGNRILTLASAFLYAILTDRVLLVDRGIDILDLFCEPFPEASWLLPVDFPLTNRFNDFNQKSNESYGNVLKRSSSGNLNGPEGIKPYVYLHLVHDYDHQDKLFFCDQDQMYLQNIPWLIMKSDNYFIPSLFLLPSFEQELHKLFPDKETVFHFLGQYLFHPTNTVWGLISRYYESYLSKADVRVGIQIRVFDATSGPFKHVLDQVLSCTLKEEILPQIIQQENIPNTIINTPAGKKKSIAVLMTSLNLGYFEEVRNMYWESPTVKGEVVSVYQPSHEGYQQTEKHNHNRKAWAEMYLLSLMDKLVTSSWSTFGYVAQGLGGLKPWILYKPENQTAPDPPCRRGMSIEPCFHAPPFYDCKLRRGLDTGAIVPHVRHCEDMSWGLKLVQQHSEI